MWLCQNCGCFLLEGMKLGEEMRCNSLKRQTRVETKRDSFQDWKIV